MLLFAALVACQDNSLNFYGGGERKALGTSGFEYDPGDDTGSTTGSTATGPALSNGDAFWAPENAPVAIGVMCDYSDNPDDVIGGRLEADVATSQGSVHWAFDVVEEGSYQVGINAYAAGGQIFFGLTSIVLTESYTISFSATDESGNRGTPLQVSLSAFE